MTDLSDSADEIAALRADNARLRRLLDEAGMGDSLRHAFRDTVALIRTILRQTAETAADAQSYAAHLEGRLDAIVRVRRRTDTFGEVELHSLISDELLVHGALEGERATIKGPRLLLRPKPAPIFALAIHELASNATEHGALGRPEGRVTVEWSVDTPENGQILVLRWQEGGIPCPPAPSRRGFGTAVLEDVLAYDLGARTSIVQQEDGLGCTILIPLSPRIGRVVADEEGEALQPGSVN